jgi:hypothetical protein
LNGRAAAGGRNTGKSHHGHYPRNDGSARRWVPLYHHAVQEAFTLLEGSAEFGTQGAVRVGAEESACHRGGARFEQSGD